MLYSQPSGNGAPLAFQTPVYPKNHGSGALPVPESAVSTSLQACAVNNAPHCWQVGPWAGLETCCTSYLGEARLTERCCRPGSCLRHSSCLLLCQHCGWITRDVIRGILFLHWAAQLTFARMCSFFLSNSYPEILKLHKLT